jgi:hypothetical protein
VKVRIPYSAEKTFVTVQGEEIQVKPYQIIIWISVAIQDILEWDAKIPKIPAILDTGNNYHFSIKMEQLIAWAGIQPEALPAHGIIREKGRDIPLRGAAFWLHTAMGPWPLNMDEGIAVYPENGPRLPLFGLRALTNNNLQALIYGNKREAMIRTPPRWFWPF